MLDKNDDQPFPSTLQLELTTKCNLQCKMCSHTYLQENPQYFPLSLFAELAPQIMPHLDRLIIMGLGESLIHPEFDSFLKIARKYLPNKGKIELTTNGILLTPSKIDELQKYHIDRIIVSFDSPYLSKMQKLRQGTTKEIFDNIQYLGKIREQNLIKEFFFETVLSKINLYDIPDLLHFAVNHHVDKIVFSHLLPHTEELKNETLFSTISQESWIVSNKIYKEGWEVAKKMMFMPEYTKNFQTSFAKKALKIRKQIDKTRGLGIDFNPEGIFENFKRVNLYKDVYQVFQEGRKLAKKLRIKVSFPPIFPDLFKRKCPYVSQGATIINVYGDVVPCFNFIHPITTYINNHTRDEQGYSFGNINVENFNNIWRSELYQKFRARMKEISKNIPWCGDCPFSQQQCFYTESNESDCYANSPGCHECLYSTDQVRCLF